MSRRRLAPLLTAAALGIGLSGESAPQSPPAEPDGHRRMVELLRWVAAEAERSSAFLSGETLDALRAQRAAARPEQGLEEWFGLNFRLGLEEFRYGTAVEAIRHLETARGLLNDPSDLVQIRLGSRIAYYLALAHLRLGERQNCVARHTAESCILPIRPGGVHMHKDPARRAVELFREVLRSTPEKSIEHVAAKWLITLAAMAAGDYPGALSEAERVDPAVFTSRVGFPELPDVAARAGIATFSLAGGMIVDDFDGDLLPDVLTSSWLPSADPRFFRNRGDGTFTDATDGANLAGLTGGLNMVQADYDNDGDLDVYVLRGAWLREAGHHPNSLLANDGRGRFTDVTFEAGLGEVHYPTQTAAWQDYDLDGDLDLYVGNESMPDDPAPSQLFRNDGNGHFTDVAAAAGVENLLYAKAVAWGDYDADRRPDLYVSNLYGPNRLYRNRGDGTFEDVAERLGVTLPGESFGTWFWDYDNDGALDLYVTSYPGAEGPARLFMVVAGYLGLPHAGERPCLYRGDGRGGFTEVATSTGLDRITMPMGANFGDLDGDGYLDLYLGTGYPRYDGLMPNVLYWNRGGLGFEDVTFASRTGHLQKGHGVAFADFDGDGDVDLFEQLGGFYPEDGYTDALFANPGFGHHWLGLRLVGKQSNRSAIGARIRVELWDGEKTRSIHRVVGSGGTFGGNPLTQHVGLGAAAQAERIEIVWPASGVTQTFSDVAADRLLQIVEGESDFTELEPPWRRPSP